MLLEALSAIPKMWTSERFSWDGKYFRVPEREIIPKPIQQPHPPIWQASTSPESWEIAGANQIGSLGLTILLPRSRCSRTSRATGRPSSGAHR